MYMRIGFMLFFFVVDALLYFFLRFKKKKVKSVYAVHLLVQNTVAQKITHHSNLSSSLYLKTVNWSSNA